MLAAPVCRLGRFARVGAWVGVCKLVVMMFSFPAYAGACEEWPLWQSFSQHFIQQDGRVLADESELRYSSSEGQAYALFFALVAGDRDAFDRIRVWTRDNLADGDLGARLPAWQWGKQTDGNWQILDQNSASDADVWLAYTLLEAGRLWKEPRYSAQGKLMLANIRIHEIRDYPGVGAMLMPGVSGFDLADPSEPNSKKSGKSKPGIRLNASYLPVQVFRAFARAEPSGPWNSVIKNSYQLIKASAAHGFVPDWSSYVPGQGYGVDPVAGAKGAHDAIRVYLWWGMLSRQDVMSVRLKKVIDGMNRLIPAHAVVPPSSVDTQTGVVTGASPPGFSAALLPYFATMGNKEALRLQRERLLVLQDATTNMIVDRKPRYYDQVLSLFGLGWTEQRFSFSSKGQLAVQWKQSCSAEK